MTSPADRREEFFEECVDGRETRRLESDPDRKREAERYLNQAGFHRQSVRDSLNGEAELMAIRQGYYVMLHKANQALALAGFRSRSHRCTLLGLRGVFDAPALADQLRRASEERNNIDYAMNPEEPELVEFEDPESFVDDVVDPFVHDVDARVGRELGLSRDEWQRGTEYPD